MRILISGLAAAALCAAANTSTQVTFYKDALPVLQKNCQSCHRAGEAGPMQFTSYESTRPWAKSIKQAVLTKKMPPWFADPHYGKFANDRSLTEGEIKTLVAWADGGA
jgi:cytochrome c5